MLHYRPIQAQSTLLCCPWRKKKSAVIWDSAIYSQMELRPNWINVVPWIAASKPDIIQPALVGWVGLAYSLYLFLLYRVTLLIIKCDQRTGKQVVKSSACPFIILWLVVVAYITAAIHTLALGGRGRMKTNDKANWEYGVRISAFAANILNINVWSDELHDELTTSMFL